uniref:Branched-chain-amino-acid aminotransferase n=1 Tax=Syphacia muris TaxID=451379 RepID=A0A0N5AWF5_9BILA
MQSLVYAVRRRSSNFAFLKHFSILSADNVEDVEVLKRCRSAKSFQFKDLVVTKAKPEQLLQKPKYGSHVRFGEVFSDYMAEVDWSAKSGWSKPIISPLHNLSMHPAAKVFHYAIEVFEGMKAYRGVDGKIRLFRPDRNMERLRSSAKRAALPDFSGTELLNIIIKLVCMQKDWVPHTLGYTLYIRPALIGTDGQLGVAISHSAKLFVITGPSGPYFDSKVTLYADPDFTRSFSGGVGSYKAGCNYMPTIMISTEAQSKNCQQVLWLYGADEWITEVGATNIFFIWTNTEGEEELITPPLDDGLILPGITRDSVLELVKKWDTKIKVSERFVGMPEFRQAVKENRVHEAFCTGTACLISPVEKILYKNKRLNIIEELKMPKKSSTNCFTERICKAITDIQVVQKFVLFLH